MRVLSDKVNGPEESSDQLQPLGKSYHAFLPDIGRRAMD
jgi:hypothetical protein